MKWNFLGVGRIQIDLYDICKYLRLTVDGDTSRRFAKTLPNKHIIFTYIYGANNFTDQMCWHWFLALLLFTNEKGKQNVDKFYRLWLLWIYKKGFKKSDKLSWQPDKLAFYGNRELLLIADGTNIKSDVVE